MIWYWYIKQNAGWNISYFVLVYTFQHHHEQTCEACPFYGETHHPFVQRQCKGHVTFSGPAEFKHHTGSLLISDEGQEEAVGIWVWVTAFWVSETGFIVATPHCTKLRRKKNRWDMTLTFSFWMSMIWLQPDLWDFSLLDNQMLTTYSVLYQKLDRHCFWMLIWCCWTLMPFKLIQPSLYKPIYMNRYMNNYYLLFWSHSF